MTQEKAMFGTYTWIMNDAERAAFALGQEAYQAGLNAHANPYVSNTPLWQAWNDGLDCGSQVEADYSRPYDEGYIACDGGVKKEDNPYIPGTPWQKAWDEGWDFSRQRVDDALWTVEGDKGPRLGEEVCHIESPF